MTLPYLAYAVTVLLAGFAESALRRAPVAYVALAQELGLRNAGTNQDMLNLTQAKELANKASGLAGEEREQALSYAKAALDALAGETAFSHKQSPVSHEQEARSLPSLDILETVEKARTITNEEIRDMEQLLDDTISSFVPAEVRHDYTMIGPRIIRFGILPTGVPVMVNNAPKRDSAGRVAYSKRTKIEQITSREKDLQAALGVKTILMLPPVPGKHHVGVEIPNPYPALVSLRDVLGSSEYQAAHSRSKLMFVLGPDVAGQVHFCDIAKAPHLLIAGATGAGKSMLLNVLIASILTQATPDDVRLLMIDPKQVELTPYNGIPHLLRPVVTDPDQAVPLLDNAIAEMERRYKIFSQVGVRKLEGYRKQREQNRTLENLPSVVIIIDELADLMMTAPKEVEERICRIAQKARATGIHLVIATQRPSVDVITGLIKANIPTRIAFMVASWRDSQTILDAVGADKLLGKGDMLYLPSDAAAPTRIQGAFMTDQDAQSLADYWREAESEGHHETWPDQPEDEPGDDEKEETSRAASAENGDELLLAKIVAEILPGRETLSISFIQTTYQTAYRRAARIITMLEERGYVSAPEGNRGERRVLMAKENSEEVTASEANV